LYQKKDRDTSARVKNLIGGIIAWEKAGSEVIKD